MIRLKADTKLTNVRDVKRWMNTRKDMANILKVNVKAAIATLLTLLVMGLLCFLFYLLGPVLVFYILGALFIFAIYSMFTIIFDDRR
jgi:hypothetical protein